jgi:hypothetical protein
MQRAGQGRTDLLGYVRRTVGPQHQPHGQCLTVVGDLVLDDVGESGEWRAQPQWVHGHGCPVRCGEGDRVVTATVHAGEPAERHPCGISAGGEGDRVGQFVADEWLSVVHQVCDQRFVPASAGLHWLVVVVDDLDES